MSNSNYREANISYSMLPSAQALHKYGIPRSTAVYIIQNHWAIDSQLRDIISSYYLLHWSASYFQNKMVEGTIEREGVTYQVIYHKCNVAAISRGIGQLKLSFRELQDEYNAMPIVLVTVA